MLQPFQMNSLSQKISQPHQKKNSVDNKASNENIAGNGRVLDAYWFIIKLIKGKRTLVDFYYCVVYVISGKPIS